MNEFLEELVVRLRQLEDEDLYRTLRTPMGIDFSSNDYLGLSADGRLREALAKAALPDTLTAPASRLLRGHTDHHLALEKRLASFKGTEAALLFSSGYQANIGVLTALVGASDRVLSDELNHASLIDGIRLCGATKAIYPHLDLTAIEGELSRPHESGRTFLVTESLFSMEGNIAPLDRYAELAKRYDAQLIVDDTHATGLYGDERGSGLTEQFGVEKSVLAVMSTLGKALGVFGAFVGGSSVVVDYLINCSRPFVFTTAQPPLLLAVVTCALDLVEQETERRTRVHELTRRFRGILAGQQDVEIKGEGPIVPIMLGDAKRALRVASTVQAKGFDVRAVRPPTVPAGTSRLRVSIHADRSEAQIDALAEAIATAVNQTRSLATEAAAV